MSRHLVDVASASLESDRLSKDENILRSVLVPCVLVLCVVFFFLCVCVCSFLSVLFHVVFLCFFHFDLVFPSCRPPLSRLVLCVGLGDETLDLSKAVQR